MALDRYVVYATVLFPLQHYSKYIKDEAHSHIDGLLTHWRVQAIANSAQFSTTVTQLIRLRCVGSLRLY